MTGTKYTTEDYAAAKFAMKQDKFTACRSVSGFWRTESGAVLEDRDMAYAGWVPVPSPPATPTITESEYQERVYDMTFSERVAFDNGFDTAGGAVVPDPEPTNVELIEKFLTDYSRARGGGVDGAAALARHLDAAGVIAPGSEE